MRSSRIVFCLGAIGAAALAGCSGDSRDAGAGDLETGIAVVRSQRPERAPTLAQELASRVDPARDGWSSEVLSAAAGKRLKKLAKLLERGDGAAGEPARSLAAADYSSAELRPGNLDEVFSDGVFTVRRWKPDRSGSGEREPEYAGPEGFETAVRELVAGTRAKDGVRVALKLVEIEEAADFFTTRAVLVASQPAEGATLQQNAIWDIDWVLGDETPHDTKPGSSGSEALPLPRVRRIELVSYEEVEVHGEAATLFADSTRTVLGGNPSYERQVLPGINHWLGRVSLIAGMSIVGHHGIAVGDANGDGLEDLYVCDAAGLPNRLYIQNENGTATDDAAAAGVDWLEASSSALFVDLDSDGDQDLVVAFKRRLLIHENDGHGRFQVRSDHRDVVTSSSSLSAADYDEDGDLDLYLCGYDGDPNNKELPGPIPYHDARNGGANVLLENRGGFRFDDVTAETGLDENNHRFSFSSAWDDYDGDGDLDLYVANDFGRNHLYRNDGAGSRPRFTDVAARAGVEDVAAGMSAAWGDFNRDGRPDMYVSNMFSSAGGRIADKERFIQDAPERTASDLRRMARGNTLFENLGGRFRDVSETAGVTLGRWAWGSKFADLNNDSWPDLVVTNGYVTNEDTDDL